MLVVSSFAFLAPNAFATGPTVHNTDATECHSSCGVTLSLSITPSNVGDIMIVSAQTIECVGSSCSPQGPEVDVASVTATGYTFILLAKQTFSGLNGGGAFAYTSDMEYWTAVVPNTSPVSITVTFTGSPSGSQGGSGNMQAMDATGVPRSYLASTGSCPTGSCGSGAVHTASSVGWQGAALAIGSIIASNAALNFPAGVGWTQVDAIPQGQGGIYYDVFPSTSTTNFQQGSTSSTALWTFFGVVLQSPFTCSITNFDGPNYVAAGNGKFYDFFCQIQSQSIGANAAITDVKVQFNDSAAGSCNITCFSTGMPNVVEMEYNNVTGSASLDQGGSIASLGTPKVVNAYDSSTGVRSMNITFPVSLNANAVNAVNRGIQLYASLAGGASRGLEYVKTDYFNIINKGGLTTMLISGDCSVPAGAGTFGMICQYGANSHNWIAENTTYYQLQQYQAQFAVQLNNVSNGAQTPGFWQNYAASGGGTNPSSNPKDWQIRGGLYYWDNSSATCCWVKGVNYRVYMLEGSVGSSNLWTEWVVEWYNGNTLVQNSTGLVPYVPNDVDQSQVNIWVNLWYSQDNASTSQGGEIGTYYTGMFASSSLLWAHWGWQPVDTDLTQVEALMPVKNSTGQLMSNQQAQLTKVFMNMSRPGVPLVHAKQFNFQVETDGFQEQEFNVAPGGTMGGITDPTFAVAIIPVITGSGTSIFSPIINALKALAGWIAKGFQALGTLVWASLGAQFPWFTNFWSGVGSALQAFFKLFEDVITSLVSFLIVFASWFSELFNPIFSTLSGAWTQINSLLSWTKYIPTQDIAPTIEVFIIIVFGLSLLEAFFTNDWPYVIKLASGGWRVTEAILTWTWRLAKFVVDVITGLIP